MMIFHPIFHNSLLYLHLLLLWNIEQQKTSILSCLCCNKNQYGRTNSYYSQGKANATVNKVLIGSHTASINTTSCSFNCTSIPGWSNLTSENFSFIPTGGYMNFQSHDEIRSHSDRAGNVSISYNNSTGVVTVSGLKFGVQTYTEVYSWVALSGNVYCYIVTD